MLFPDIKNLTFHELGDNLHEKSNPIIWRQITKYIFPNVIFFYFFIFFLSSTLSGSVLLSIEMAKRSRQWAYDYSRRMNQTIIPLLVRLLLRDERQNIDWRQSKHYIALVSG